MPRNKGLLEKDFVKHEEMVKTPLEGVAPNRVRLIRLVNDMDISELSEKLGISASMLQQIEMQQKPLSTNVLISLSELFGISTDYILYQTSSIYKKNNNKELKTNISELKRFFRKE